VTAFLADVWEANAHYLHTPMLVAEAAVRDGLLRDPHIRKTLGIAQQRTAKRRPTRADADKHRARVGDF
jgi:DNA-binding transcriptional regulator LsrR (DeoR family)